MRLRKRVGGRGEGKAEGVGERKRLSSIHRGIGMDRERVNSRGIFTLK